MENSTQKVNIKEIVRQEYVSCLKSATYFTKKYCWIQNPTKGRMQFNLFRFQEKVNDLFQDTNNKYIIINKLQNIKNDIKKIKGKVHRVWFGIKFLVEVEDDNEC
jgi:hypothetical protein